jgi:peptide/nickel transport system ATP-binding protein/oligopeptide transport system ATP-binding protein
MSLLPMNADTLLQARDLVFAYAAASAERNFELRVADLAVRAGEVMAVCGPSGCGKSTLLSILAGQLRPSSGQVWLSTDGGPIELHGGSAAEWRRHRRHLGFVDQDLRETLNDRRNVADIVADPIKIHRLPGLPAGPRPTSVGRFADRFAGCLHFTGARLRRERRARAIASLQQVGITRAQAERRPGSLSGGQRQRVAIARALVAQPRLVFLDEPTSALDVSVQASVIELLQELRRQDGRIAYVLVTHDLPLARQMADRVAVLDQGRIVEQGDVDRVFRDPVSPIMRELLGIARADLAAFAPGIEG